VLEVHKDVALRVINSMKGAEHKGKRISFEPLKR